MAMTNQNEAQTIARIEELKDNLAHNFGQICELLTMVSSHYLHRDPLFRHYREIASGKLLPELVMAMGLKRGYLPHIMGRPREVQLQIARDADLSWCCAVRGEIVERRTSWKAMGAADFKRMFPIGQAVRSLPEQIVALKEEMAVQPVAYIRGQPLARVDMAEQTFRLGSQVVPLSVVVSAMQEAGMRVNAQPLAE